jgi:hypothetical protein
MSDISPSPLAESGITIPSDSENYDANHESSTSSPASSASPLVLYKTPSLWGLVRGAAINLLLPFVNGLMLGFGELVANEAAFRLGWSGTKVRLSLYSVLDGVCGEFKKRIVRANKSCDADFPIAPW